ncbi:hypothetical protein CDL15_Pgr014434 [Punica granatum]|uniref:Serpin domain-containing protein n=1 Tax=Punica granatum TaxID=22663 RepID=A0A218WEX2_PUNGR|nr:hypothetical protein CDL15_Pgr014434 [Punica granatum]
MTTLLISFHNQNLLRYVLGGRSTETLGRFSEEEVERVFEGKSPVGGPKLSVAYGAWIERSPRRSAVEEEYKNAAKFVDFRNNLGEVVNQVNEWAKKETNRLNDSIVTPADISKLTVLVLANALYFKRAWVEKFDVSRARDNYFYPPSGQAAVRVPFMTSDKDQFIGTYEGFKVLWLDYEQGGDLDRSLSTCFFLPDEWDGLRGLMEKACSDPEFLKYHVPYNKVPVGQFRIPKFKILSKFDDLTDHLHNLGVPKRCLLEVAENELISVSRIIQKAFVEINKEGTEAAAVTAMVGRAGCAMDFSPPKYVDFVADHPFMLVI